MRLAPLRGVRDFLLQQHSHENSGEDRGERGLQYGFHTAVLLFIQAATARQYRGRP